MNRYRVIIADDEPLQRDALRTALQREPDMEVIAVCEDGDTALEVILNERPDLAMLDVQMPGLTGIQIVDALPADSRPVIVFVTAFDDYAVRAFEVNAVDYLLKPFDTSRLQAALQRARQRLTEPRPTDSAGADPTGLDLAVKALHRPAHWAQRILPVAAGRIRVMPVADVEWLEAKDNYVRVHTGAGAGLLRETLTSLHARLDPAVFLRVHRSAVVNVHRIRELRPRTNGDFQIVMTSGAVTTLSRTYSRDVLHRLG